MYEKLCRQLRAMASTWGLSLPSDAADAIEERCQQVDKFAEEAARLYAKQPKWIPVTERLPSNGHSVLVFYAEQVCTAYLTNTTSSGCLCWVEGYGNYVEVNDNKIKFWMPLPEPPKEEK